MANVVNQLNDMVVSNFKLAKYFRSNTDRINFMDFSSSGELLISSAKDDQIIVYDCEKGIRRSTLCSKKYGVDLIHFTHAKNAVIHSSTKIDDTVRYMSLYDNKYIRYFNGHSKRVTNLRMSPRDDTFLTTSLDKTLRLWDLRSSSCTAVMSLGENPGSIAYDPEGLVFAVGLNNESIKLYDARSYDNGPFVSFRYSREVNDNNNGSSLKFSPNGKMIMIYGQCSIIKLLDAFTGLPLQTLNGFKNSGHLDLEASFSPDSKFIFSGSSDGLVHVWNVECGYKVCALNGDHIGPVPCVKFNPKYMMLASSCSKTVFWTP